MQMMFGMEKSGQKVYIHGSRQEMKVALTFDDGPNPPLTAEILEVLAQKKVQATFFLVGKSVQRWPEMAQLVHDHGHLLGNHGYAHQPGKNDFADAAPFIQQITGIPPHFIRAPRFDCRNYVNLERELLETTLAVHADIIPGDYRQTDPELVASRVLANERLAGGSIILLHDGFRDGADDMRLTQPRVTVAALPQIIDGLRELGYELVRLDQMTFPPPSPCVHHQPRRTRALRGKLSVIGINRLFRVAK